MKNDLKLKAENFRAGDTFLSMSFSPNQSKTNTIYFIKLLKDSGSANDGLVIDDYLIAGSAEYSNQVYFPIIKHKMDFVMRAASNFNTKDLGEIMTFKKNFVDKIFNGEYEHKFGQP